METQNYCRPVPHTQAPRDGLQAQEGRALRRAAAVPDSFLGVSKGLAEAGEVRVEVGGRGDDFQESRVDLRGEPGWWKQKASWTGTCHLQGLEASNPT